MATIYYARRILLPDMTLLEHGGVSVENGRIRAVDQASHLKRARTDRVVNLGEMLLMPGLINLHTHLEETAIRSNIRSLDNESFAAFSMKKESRIRSISDAALAASVRLTTRHLLSVGTTTIVDTCRNMGTASFLSEEPIRAYSIFEFGRSESDFEEKLKAWQETRTALKNKNSRFLSGIGPHALFSLPPQAHRRLIAEASASGLLYSVHCAESAEELLAFCEQKGDLYFHITRSMPWPFGYTPLGSMPYALQENLVPPGALAIHCNQVGVSDLEALALRNVAVVTCVQYSQERGHKPFPLEVALDRSVCVCVGTETRFDAGSGSLFDEIFALRMLYPHISAATALAMVTTNPAQALGRSNDLGALKPGACADLLGVSVPHVGSEYYLDALLREEPSIRFVMIDGEEIVADY